jgi:hypothetical protein
MACACISEFESYQPSHAVPSLSAGVATTTVGSGHCGAPTSPATHALDVTLYKKTPRRKHPALTVDPPVEAAAAEVAKLGTSDQTPAQLLETSRAAKRARETKKIELIRRRQGR